jgi:hypothetical protein
VLSGEITGGGFGVKETSDQKPERLDEFKKRAQRIRDRLDQADKIFDNLQEERKKPDKATGILQEIFEPIERGLKKLFSTSFSEIMKPIDGQERPGPLVPRKLAQFLRSCSDEQLAAIKDEVNGILRERGIDHP